jgi:hypothetical protein
MAPTADETNLSARKTSASEACLDVTRKGTASRIWDLHNQIKIKRSPFAVRRSPFTVRRSAAQRHYARFAFLDLTKAPNGSALPPEAMTS